MKTLTLTLTFVTDALCGGADNKTCAEVRASSIRGQLRWWFRVLGGRAGDRRPLREQEEDLFGGVHGTAQASKLRLAVANPPRSFEPKNLENLGYNQFGHPIGYLLFPLRPKKDESNARGLLRAETKFSVRVQWTGATEDWDMLRALLRIFVEFGALGARSRRTAGGIALENDDVLPPLGSSLRAFEGSNKILATRFDPKLTAEDAQSELGKWLMRWRAHGQTGKNQKEKTYPGFRYAIVDHDIGAARLEGRPIKGPAHRAALGLPIVQKFSNRGTVNWTRDGDDARFASPVLLRVRRLGKTQFEPLILFILPRRWNVKDKVRLKDKKNTRREAVVEVESRLFDLMRQDAEPLTALFPG